MKRAIFGIFFLYLSSGMAFTWNKCKTDVMRIAGKGMGLNNDASAYTAACSIGSSTSSTQFVSSTGGCKAFGQLEKKRHEFVAKSFYEIEVDSAKGQGPYIENLARLSGCAPAATPLFGDQIQKNYKSIYQGPFNYSDEFLDKIDVLIEQTPELQQDCHPDQG